jgi:hypothetical protein
VSIPASYAKKDVSCNQQGISCYVFFPRCERKPYLVGHVGQYQKRGSIELRGSYIGLLASLSFGILKIGNDIMGDGTAILSTKEQLRGSLENVQTCPVEVSMGL